MKIQDIRIGSYIRGYYDEGSEDTAGGERKYIDFKVVNILGTLDEVESEEGEIFHIDDCEGIPLTEEVLILIGLNKDREYFYEKKADGYTIRYLVGSGKFKVNVIKDNKITTKIRIYTKCIHEIQNALWDAGLNDIADNLKTEEL